jgi:phosphatidylserine/phosphatidylglycerophosphate/cardiolipin synthase-like enzyme
MTGALQKKMNFTPVFGLHAKSMVIDQKISVIGTFNLDPRSANLNTECIAVIYDDSVARRLHQSMDEDRKLENAWHTTFDFNPDGEAGWVKRSKVWLRAVVPKSIL